MVSQYFDRLVTEDPFGRWTPVLAKHIPHMMQSEIVLVTRLLITPKAQQSQLALDDAKERSIDGADIQDLLQQYDAQIGDGEYPDPAFLVVILSIHPFYIRNKESLQPQSLQNSLYALAALTLAERDTSAQLVGAFQAWGIDTVPNLIAVQAWLAHDSNYFVTGVGSQLLTSFFHSHEFRIVHSAFMRYLTMARGSSTMAVLSLPAHFGNAVRTIFNSHLTELELIEGWNILSKILSEWELYSPEWQCAFVASFFPCSSRQLPSMRPDLPIHFGLALSRGSSPWNMCKRCKWCPSLQIAVGWTGS